MTTGWKIVAAIALAAAAIWGWNNYTTGLVAKGDKAGYARANGEYKDRELAAIKKVREEEGRRIAALQGVIDGSKKDLVAARAAADAAAGAGQRLRSELAAVRARSRACTGTAVAIGGPPADAAEGLLADVQRRVDEATERIARHADESRIAGQACERAYDSLTGKP